jgi:hypothetical protein
MGVTAPSPEKVGRRQRQLPKLGASTPTLDPSPIEGEGGC